MQSTSCIVKKDLNILSCKELAVFLLGKLLVRKLDNDVIMKGRIVETECYLGGDDKASHSQGNRRTPGNEPMYMPPGTCYVYMTYGMYFCFNISSKEPGAAVLLRALHPISGLEQMEKLRTAKKRTLKKLNEVELCNGPSKLCMAMDIRKDNCNKLDLCGGSDMLWLEYDPEFNAEINMVTSSRIGVASAGEEWAQKPLRFYIMGCPNVSKRDKHAETQVLIKANDSSNC